jgi:hypothetical protein
MHVATAGANQRPRGTGRGRVQRSATYIPPRKARTNRAQGIVEREFSGASDLLHQPNYYWAGGALNLAAVGAF